MKKNWDLGLIYMPIFGGFFSLFIPKKFTEYFWNIVFCLRTYIIVYRWGYRYGHSYRPIPITDTDMDFPYRQNWLLAHNRYIGRYRYLSVISTYTEQWAKGQYMTVFLSKKPLCGPIIVVTVTKSICENNII